jgi:two-component system nitrogen regulation sensor histidine kinase NtrY
MEDKPNKSSKRIRNLIILVVVFSLFLAGNIYIFGKLEKEEGFFNPYIFLIILNIDFVFFLTILALSLRHLIKLFFEKRDTHGQLRKKLLLILISMVIIPAVILSVASISLISNATKIWFSGKVEKALKSVQIIIDKNIELNVKQLDKVAFLIQKKEINPQKAINYFNLQSIVIIKGNKKRVYGKLVKYVENTKLKHKTDYKIYYFHNTMFIRFYKKIDNSTILIIDKRLPEFISKKESEIKNILKLYSEFKRYKSPIRIGYILTMLTITMFVIFASIWFSQYIVRNLTYPIEQLAEAAKKLASGNLKVKVNAVGKYEIGLLIEEFNNMVKELNNLYIKLEKSNRELQYKNEYLDAILENARTGVIYSNDKGIVEKINKSAINILNIKPEEVIGRDIFNVFKQLGIDPNTQKEQTIKYHDRILIVKISKIANTKKGYVIVFDDITDIVNAQKVLAWKEIAQRIAHEIKNPLTPIKLSAERILRQYKKQNPRFEEILEKSTDVIIKEVEHLSNLVKEFGQFASIENKLNIEEISLKDFFEELKNSYRTEDFKIDIQIEGDIKIKGDKKLLKQAFTNIIQNAYEVTAGQKERLLNIKVKEEKNKIKIEFRDNGKGISKEDIKKIFDPYFSKKTKGTGLGLAITKEIIEKHNGKIYAVPSDKGGIFIIELPKK